MFQYAVSNWIYGDEDLESTCCRLQRFGFDAVELVGEPERYTSESLAALHQKYGLGACSVLSWCLWPMEERDLAHPDPGMRRRAIEYVCRNVDLAVAACAPTVVVIPAPSGRPSPYGAHTEAGAWQEAARREWELSVDSVRQVCRYAQEKGIVIAVEPINRFETYLLNNVDQGLCFVKDVGLPNVKLHLDTFHMNIEDADMSGAVLTAGSLLASMHLSDSNRGAVGRGHTDFRGVVNALLQIGFQGPLILEPLPLHPNPFVALKLEQYRDGWDRDVEESINTLRELEAGR